MQRWKKTGICVLLVVLVFVVFGRTVEYGFINYDDGTYVYDNPHVLGGLSAGSIGWAFTHIVSDHWHPLTMLSLMLDRQLYGSWAGGYHLTNLLLHAIAVILLFLVLEEMTGALWSSAFVAAVFAIHPLRAESVAWISERKDVLSGVFFMLTLGAYLRYARKPMSPGRYLPLVLCFALGLMSKGTLVTLPFVLLLLDYWPLRRFQSVAGTDIRAIRRKVLFEKIPLVALSAASCVITLLAASSGVRIGDQIAFPLRAANAFVSWIAYIGQLFYPVGLAPFYPFPYGLPLWEGAVAALVLACISIAAIARRKTEPWLAVGWFWYLGTLAPIIGFISPGGKARADRYTYLSEIGLCLALTWMVTHWRYPRGENQRRLAHGVTGVAIITVLVLCADTQTSYWHDSASLWAHGLDCTPDNFVARRDLGFALFQQGRTEEAIDAYRAALKVDPAQAQAHYNLANALFQRGLTDEAIVEYRAALQISDFAEARNNLGIALLHQGRTAEAVGEFDEALRINPAFAGAHDSLGNALRQQGRTDDAIVQYREALKIDPAFTEAHGNLGNALRERGQIDEAIAEYREALRIDPANAEVHSHLFGALLQRGQVKEAIGQVRAALELQPANPQFQNNLAWVLATVPQPSLRDGARALELAIAANQETGGNNPLILHTLAAAYAATGQFSTAVQTAQQALPLAEAQSNSGLADALRREIKAYQAGQDIR